MGCRKNVPGFYLRIPAELCNFHFAALRMGSQVPVAKRRKMGKQSEGGRTPESSHLQALRTGMADLDSIHASGTWISRAVPQDDGVCSLSDILIIGSVPMRYFLSRDASKGILNRAAKRGKELPEDLKSALLEAAGLK